MFFVLHVNDDRHACDNVMEETFNITRIRGHVCMTLLFWNATMGRVVSVCK